jgi:hypothetical protein
MEFCATRKTPEAIAACGNCSASAANGWLKPLCGLSMEFCATRKTPEAIAACGNCSASTANGWLKPLCGLSVEFCAKRKFHGLSVRTSGERLRLAKTPLALIGFSSCYHLSLI